MVLLECRNLTLSFPEKKNQKREIRKEEGNEEAKEAEKAGSVFRNVSMTVENGERVSLTGRSGCGKTLFLRSLCLLEPRLEGEILWNGKIVKPHAIPHYRSQILYVGQRGSLPAGTVREAFEELFHFKVHKNKKWDQAATKDALLFFGKPNPEQFLSRKTQSLSGGERQLVSLLRATALSPAVLCLDEPTSALDFETVRKVEEWLQIRHAGAWIWVTHQPDQAQRVGVRSIPFEKTWKETHMGTR